MNSLPAALKNEPIPVNSFSAAFKNELLLLACRKRIIGLAVFSSLLPILLASSLNAIASRFAFVAVSGSFPVQMLSLYTAILIPLFVIFTLADQFPQEVAARTMKLTLLRPVTRFKAYAAKIGALAAGVAVLLLLAGLASVLCAALSGSPVPAAEWAGVLRGYAAAYVSMAALTALFALTAQLFRSVNGYLAFSILFYAAAKLLPFVIRPFSAFSVTGYTDWYVLWLGGDVPAFKLITTSSFLLSGSVLFFSIGYWLFDRKDH